MPNSPIPPFLLLDAYKLGHPFQYPQGLEYVSSNDTPRGGRLPGSTHVVHFGLQYPLQEYLAGQWVEGFFEQPIDKVLAQYKRYVYAMLGPDAVTVDHIAQLHDHGRLPLRIKALPEGALVPYGVPLWTIENTDPAFGWVTNSVETLLQNTTWMSINSATIAWEFRKEFERWAKITGADPEFIKWQGHDFSMRGMSGIEAACMSAAGHLLSFTGTDTVPVLPWLEEFYSADVTAELIGGSVPATEHSVMCAHGQADELETFRHLITQVYPNGVVSIVSDTWNLWEVVRPGGYLEQLKGEIMSRDGKVVIRPDSGDPVKIICGDPNHEGTGLYDECIRKGVVQCLWDIFGGDDTAKGHAVLDSHIGFIDGDGINLDRQHQMLSILASKGFAFTGVLGIGSYPYQHTTRDEHGLATKATWCQVNGEGINIFKKPFTDDGGKFSAKGLLQVVKDHTGEYVLHQEVTRELERTGELKVVFEDGVLTNYQNFSDIRARLLSNL